MEGWGRDESGAPLSGVRVGEVRWGAVWGQNLAETLTDAEGHYRLAGLAIGSSTLDARPQGCARVTRDTDRPDLGWSEGDGGPL